MTAFVSLVGTVGQRPPGHIHLATENRLECKFLLILGYFGLDLGTDFLPLLGGSLFETLLCILYFTFELAFEFVDIVEILLHAKHIAMIGKRETRHTVFQGFVYEPCHGGLAVKKRILAMDVEMYELWHVDYRVKFSSKLILFSDMGCQKMLKIFKSVFNNSGSRNRCQSKKC